MAAFNGAEASSYSVVFIRHFRCGYCQDFLVYLSYQTRLKPQVLQQAGVNLVIIGCGSWEFIAPYKSSFQFDLLYPITTLKYIAQDW